MLRVSRLAVLASTVLLLLLIPLVLASSARAGVKLYQGSWVAESFGNDRTMGTGGQPESDLFSVFGMPQGLQCHPGQPRCPFSQTPVSVSGTMGLTPAQFDPLGAYCAPNSAFGLAPTRPAKGGTAATTGGARVPPFYRNPGFFTAGGAPNATSCSATSTVGGGSATMPLTTNDPLRGIVMKGKPLTGSGSAYTVTGPDPRAFSFPAAPATPTMTPGPTQQGFRRTTLGEFNNLPPYLYSYTYATLRNSAGYFYQGGGFFSTGAAASTASFPYIKGGKAVARAVAKKGPDSFGGVMRLLGKLTTKVCYFRNGGCSLGGNNWRYEAVGTSGIKAGGVLTDPYTVMYEAIYYHTALMQQSTVMVIGSRFPWTTGSVTVTATGRGPHNTIERRKGADNRVDGVGTVQLVTPIITRWLQPAANFETGGIGILRLSFAPEPGRWVAMVAGLSLVGVLFGFRRR